MQVSNCAKVHVSALAMLAAAKLLCGAQGTALQVTSAILDPKTHMVKVELYNSSPSKTIVAYFLDAKSFDSEGKLLADLGTGWDYLGKDVPNPRFNLYVGPQHTVYAQSSATETAASVQVTVSGVVYSDRTFEGPKAVLIFAQRARQAKLVQQALALLNYYPEKPEETHALLQRLLAIDDAAINTTLSNKLNLIELPNKDHPPAEDAFSREQWEDVKGELSAIVAFDEANSEGVKQ